MKVIAIWRLDCRHVPPPLAPDGGGFFYLRRKSDGAILLDPSGDYVRFDDESEAQRYASPDIDVRWMPKMRAN